MPVFSKIGSPGLAVPLDAYESGAEDDDVGSVPKANSCRFVRLSPSGSLVIARSVKILENVLSVQV